MWRTLFAAIDLNGDNVIDFEEFLTFVTQLKRGGAEAKRRLCFRLFDSNQDGFAEKADFRCILETKLAVLRRPSWQTSTTVASSGTEAPDEYMQFFSLCDEDSDGRICYEDFETYCAVHGEGIVPWQMSRPNVRMEAQPMRFHSDVQLRRHNGLS
ncbi:unnamed protein product [Durusdinium trenchii]|uniref:EF-hand domain-containing protein n=1 Tax=Durusdinium trenchii TaxID=1381693 RepID=A0ABP0KDZ2_9DINO